MLCRVLHSRFCAVGRRCVFCFVSGEGTYTRENPARKSYSRGTQVVSTRGADAILGQDRVVKKGRGNDRYRLEGETPCLGQKT